MMTLLTDPLHENLMVSDMVTNRGLLKRSSDGTIILNIEEVLVHITTAFNVSRALALAYIYV